MHHSLKLKRCFFEPVLDGRKTFEIRRNSDRGFQAGDTCTLNEVDDGGVWTGRQFVVTITYVLNYEQREDFVVFAFVPSAE